jgi:hypothetical protein
MFVGDPRPLARRLERFSFADIQVLKFGDRATDGANREISYKFFYGKSLTALPLGAFAAYQQMREMHFEHRSTQVLNAILSVAKIV